MSSNRYVRVRCPICNATSPVCDQAEDIRRHRLFEWWSKHRDTHLPLPIIESAHAGGDCTGRDDCAAEHHTHGCYADKGVCDAPSEHFATRGSADV